MDFSPELTSAPSSLNSVQLLSQLPQAYLSNPTASNYVALGVVYALMGLGTPSDPTYVDRVLTGVFTALNDKAASMGLPIFDPPSTLDPLASTKVAALLDKMIIHKANKDNTCARLLETARLIFSPYEHLGSKAVLSHSANDAIDHLIDLGYPCPPSTTNKKYPGTFNYDAILTRELQSVGSKMPKVFPEGIPETILREAISDIISHRLLPTSSFIKSFNPERGNFGGYFDYSAHSMAVDFFKRNKYLSREVSSDTHNLDGDGAPEEEYRDIPDMYDRNDEEVDLHDMTKCLTSFRNYLIDRAPKYSRNPESLVQIFDLLLQGYKQSEIRQMLHLTTGPYRDRFIAIRAIGANFAKTPEYATFIQTLF